MEIGRVPIPRKAALARWKTRALCALRYKIYNIIIYSVMNNSTFIHIHDYYYYK
jgi:hypothetical protein